MEYFDKVKEILADGLEIDGDKIKMESSMEDLGADSLQVVEMIMALEEEYDIRIPDEAIKEINTVSDLVTYLEANV